MNFQWGDRVVTMTPNTILSIVWPLSYPRITYIRVMIYCEDSKKISKPKGNEIFGMMAYLGR